MNPKIQDPRFPGYPVPSGVQEYSKHDGQAYINNCLGNAIDTLKMIQKSLGQHFGVQRRN